MKTRNAPLPDTVAELQAQLLAERRMVPERLKLIKQLRRKIEADAERLTQKDTELTVKDNQLKEKDKKAVTVMRMKLKPSLMSVGNQNANPYPKICREKRLSMMSMTSTAAVADTSFIKSARISVKSWRLSRLS